MVIFRRTSTKNAVYSCKTLDKYLIIILLTKQICFIGSLLHEEEKQNVVLAVTSLAFDK